MALYFEMLEKYWHYFINGAVITLEISLCTVVFGVLLGILIALMRISSIKPLSWLAAGYIEIIRGTPLLLQIYIIFYGLSKIGINLPTFIAGILALSINSAAYVAEIFRAGIQAVDKGQTEASRSLGMTSRMTMFFIVLPQAIRNILPALGNEFVVVIKESSLVSVISLHDLMFNAKAIIGILYDPWGPLITAGLVYFVLTFTSSRLVGLLERRLRAGD